MRIVVNGEPRDVEEGLTVAQLVKALGLHPRFIAVERNERLVPRTRHEQEGIEPGDRIEIVTLVGGG